MTRHGAPSIADRRQPAASHSAGGGSLGLGTDRAGSAAAGRRHGVRFGTRSPLTTELLLFSDVGAADRRDRRPGGGSRRRGRRVAAGQLVLRRAVLHVDHRRARATSSASSCSSASRSRSARSSTRRPAERHESQRARVEATALARSAATLAADPEALPRSDRTDPRHVRARSGATAAGRRRRHAGYDTSTDRGARLNRPAPLPVGDSLGSRERLPARAVRSALDAATISVWCGRSPISWLLPSNDHNWVETPLRPKRSPRSTRCAQRCCERCRTICARRWPRSKRWCRGCSTPTCNGAPSRSATRLVTVDEEADRLNRLVGNLLDASRLQIGALAVNIQTVDMAESIAATLASIGVVRRSGRRGASRRFACGLRRPGAAGAQSCRT